MTYLWRWWCGWRWWWCRRPGDLLLSEPELIDCAFGNLEPLSTPIRFFSVLTVCAWSVRWCLPAWRADAWLALDLDRCAAGDGGDLRRTRAGRGGGTGGGEWCLRDADDDATTGLVAGLGDLSGVRRRGGGVGGGGTARERSPPDVEGPVVIAGTFNKKAVLSQAVLYCLKFAENIHYKFKSSEASKATLQSSKLTGAKQNLTQNGYLRSFKVTCVGVSWKAIRD